MFRDDLFRKKVLFLQGAGVHWKNHAWLPARFQPIPAKAKI